MQKSSFFFLFFFCSSKFDRISNTDVHVYDPVGIISATSRRERKRESYELFVKFYDAELILDLRVRNI